MLTEHQMNQIQAQSAEYAAALAAAELESEADYVQEHYSTGTTAADWARARVDAQLQLEAATLR